ncbi:hypothetical protein AC426_004076 [Salmonella enterica subsp. enterica]|nr:hypothetical protein [Salmonella enterica subsp. enterica]
MLRIVFYKISGKCHRSFFAIVIYKNCNLVLLICYLSVTNGAKLELPQLAWKKNNETF